MNAACRVDWHPLAGFDQDKFCIILSGDHGFIPDSLIIIAFQDVVNESQDLRFVGTGASPVLVGVWRGHFLGRDHVGGEEMQIVPWRLE